MQRVAGSHTYGSTPLGAHSLCSCGTRASPPTALQAVGSASFGLEFVNLQPVARVMLFDVFYFYSFIAP